MFTRILSASTISGTIVKNLKGEDIGKIQDLMVDLKTKSISYAVLSFGGFLGIGDKYYAVPVEALDFLLKDEGWEINIDISKEHLENAPGFDKDHWPTEASEDFIQSVYDHYGYKRPDKQKKFIHK